MVLADLADVGYDTDEFLSPKKIRQVAELTNDSESSSTASRPLGLAM